jgi:site-specific recombinase XerD
LERETGFEPATSYLEAQNLASKSVILTNTLPHNPYKAFIESRQYIGVSERTLESYQERLTKALKYLGNPYQATRESIISFLNTIPPNKIGYSTRSTFYRILKTFYRWLDDNYGLPYPMKHIPSPILPKIAMPTLTLQEIQQIMQDEGTRNRAIISLLVDSGLRVTEMASVNIEDMLWQEHGIKVIGKGRKERLAPFTEISEPYVKAWLAEWGKTNGSLFGLTAHAIQTLCRRIEERTGLKANPHVFRRSFATIKKQQGLDIEIIRILGGWEDLTMPARYTKAFTFKDAISVMRRITRPKPLLELSIE